MEEECMSRGHEMDSVMENIIINADDDIDDNDENTLESSVSCVDNDDIAGAGPIFRDSE
jgi:hypothetical protein